MPEPEAPAEAAPDELAQLRAELDAARQASAAARDAQLRAVAELDNVRKRAQRDIENAHRFALEKFAAELLGVRDSLELAAQNAATADATALAAGQQATLQLLAKAFEKFSIQRIDPLGAAFDPALHEAVVMQESATARPDSVLQVLQSGYQLNGRLLRPARVIVARAPQAPAAPPPA
ncbi:MAG TPA: nucleotide exchange factor GrpE [Steroidobacteraceae bacterium]|nr:nucleotide exchange factor GrpE [Steroidobacteraceae bacterium]